MKSLAQIAHERLYPSLRDPNYLVLRARRDIFTKWIAELEPKALSILDVGGRYQPYRPLFADRIGLYVAVDLKRTEFLSVAADGEALPFRQESFDVVIMTQVIDYFRNPLRAVHDLHALLRPNGVLLASIASFAPTFDELEKWRFTRSGVDSLFSAFAKVDIIPEVSTIGGLIRTVNLGMNTLLGFDALRRLHGATTGPLMNLTGAALENLRLTRNEQFTANYSVRAFKAK